MPSWQLINTSLAFSYSGSYNWAPRSIKFSQTVAQQVLSATLNLTSPPRLLPSVASFIFNAKFLRINSTSSIIDLKSLFLYFIPLSTLHFILISISHFPDVPQCSLPVLCMLLGITSSYIYNN